MNTEQLYDVFEAKKETPSEARFMFRAPLRNVTLLLDLHRDAERKLIQETNAAGGISMMYHSRGRFFGTVHAIQKVVEP